MLFVSKVDKNIKIRFYEEDDAGNPVWEVFADELSDIYVHRQCGISFTTPPYKNLIIDSDVQVRHIFYNNFPEELMIFLIY